MGGGSVCLSTVGQPRSISQEQRGINSSTGKFTFPDVRVMDLGEERRGVDISRKRNVERFQVSSVVQVLR